MTRCDYDAVFYRVFCVTLLAIAFTFTVILTNVFIDIDGLLAGKKDHKHTPRMEDNLIRDEFTSEANDNEDMNYAETDENYRTKRSIALNRKTLALEKHQLLVKIVSAEGDDIMNNDSIKPIEKTKGNSKTQSFLFHIKNPKIKNILSHRLATLLEELEAEESYSNKQKEKKIIKEERKVIPKPIVKDVELIDSNKLAEKKKTKEEEDMLHLTMHNILLEGIIGHMELNDVYKRVHTLMDNLNSINENEKIASKPNKIVKIPEETPKPVPNPTEDQFFEELIGCNELQNQINQFDIEKDERPKEKEKKTITSKDNPEVMIKTVIDITSLAKENETKRHAKENLKGVIEIIYNGKTIKFINPEIEPTATPVRRSEVVHHKPIVDSKILTETTTSKDTNDFNKIPKSILNKFVEEYFKTFPNGIKVMNQDTKRLKRNIKFKYDTEDDSYEKVKKKEPEDDELYVEIETHFDSKGLKGEKKKKLIRSLVEKIQKAIHSDLDGKLVGSKLKNNAKNRKKLHFRKRTQNPLDHSTHVLVNKYALPLNSVVHRELNPISKTISPQESSPSIGSKSGEEWKKTYVGPGFLNPSKSINSAEMSEVDVDYSKVLSSNGVSPRLQKPLNTDLSEEAVNTNSFYDLGNMKFFIKDIDGSGFSVGFNQYVDEPPDQDTMKLFSGLENVIKTYHQNYDNVEPTSEANYNIGEKMPEPSPDNQDHIIVRRSINNDHDYHSNEYKIIFDDNFLPYENYRDLFTNKKTKTKYDFAESRKHLGGMPLIIDEKIFEKNLNPAEIFGIANLLDRKKRAINVQKISSLKNKIKLNRYLNTKAMSTKKIILKKKRNKRQINKIRIIATDLPHKNSDENIFVVSDENVFADRAIVKEVETSEMDHEKHEDENEYVPYQAEENLAPTYVTKIFDSRSRHNPLMSKYPHIFMEEISRSGEDYIPESPALLFSKLPSMTKRNQNVEFEKMGDKYVIEQITPQSTNNISTTEAPKTHMAHGIYNPLGLINSPKSNYKVTVKIVPKNMSGLNSGFKEIHTSINKRFNKNGLLYSSLVNVSEISKVIKLNRSKDSEYKEHDAYMTKKIKEQQEKMQMLLKEHAKHITEQLNRLNEEKSNLDTILFDGDSNTDPPPHDYGDDIEAIKFPKITIADKDEAIKHTAVTVKETHTTVSLKTEPPTMAPVLTTTPPMFSDKVKKNIINTIERNENLTDQILKKIDKNTEILQMFLKKLTEKTIEPESPVKEEENSTITPPTTKVEIRNPFQQEWAHHGIQFNQNMVIRKNDSHISIPFVYAYQQPIMPHKRDTPVASVVYHGHIHTNAMHPKEPESPKPSIAINKPQHTNNIPEPNNQTRFFIDELENDYKVIQVGDVKKSRNINMINGTASLL